MGFYQRILLYSAALLLVISCASKKITTTAFWVNKEKINTKYHDIYLLGMLYKSENNVIVENELASQARERSIVTTRNYDVQPASEISLEMKKDLALMKIKEYKCDAICTIGIKDVKSESHYTGGSSLSVSGYAPYGSYGGYYDQFPSYYHNYYGHGGSVNMTGNYAYTSTELKAPHLETNSTYFIECNLFDAATYELLFSIQSKAVNPKDIEKASKEYCKTIFKTLEEQGVIKQKASK